MTRNLVVTFVLLGLLAVPATVWAHDKFDHQVPAGAAEAAPPNSIVQGGEGAEWELVTTLFTGNPHTDLDFFTQADGAGPEEIFASVGTLATGGNGGGQTLVQLTEDGEVVDEGGNAHPTFVADHPSATCVSNPEAALGLQHDVEATPKGSAILNEPNRFAERADTQLILDATDANGRCHDGGTLGTLGTRQGGLEIVDVTDPAAPVEIGLISHIGESHTVNVDPKRPHIVYSVTSDAVGVEDGERQNEVQGSDDELNLDGFEVADISSCLEAPLGTVPRGTDPMVKRELCRPEVFRYRYPRAEIGLGHTLQEGSGALYGCHELEVYRDDRLTCGGGNAMILFDMAGAFDDEGTPRDFTDDTLRGDPLPCRPRESTSIPPFVTGARITDCVLGSRPSPGEPRADLSIPGWLELNGGDEPRLRGVRHVGSAHHQGRGATSEEEPVTAFDATEDIDFDHEAELTGSGNFILATDERGGGVAPPGASCAPEGGGVDPSPFGNGGIHAYAVDRLDTELPPTPTSPDDEAFDPYARTPAGDKAIYRAPIRTGAQASLCTAHVFQQIPGQNRIFMGWYSQGTQVVDFIEREDGTIEFEEAAYMIPENANEWVSHIFKVDENPDGTFTYWGAAADFFIGESGRSAIDVYRVTLPAPQEAGDTEEPGPGPGPDPGDGDEDCRGADPTIVAEQGAATRGTDGDDVILGTSGADDIRGRGGNDLICSRAGDDQVGTGGGRDRAFGGGGDDLIAGSGGNDRLLGMKGDDRLDGGEGKDRLIGKRGQDRLIGGEARDFLSGRGADDVLRANAGRDELFGNSGDDRLQGGRDSDGCRGGRGRNSLRGCER